jgi:hypothetical protein
VLVQYFWQQWIRRLGRYKITSGGRLFAPMIRESLEDTAEEALDTTRYIATVAFPTRRFVGHHDRWGYNPATGKNVLKYEGVDSRFELSEIEVNKIEHIDDILGKPKRREGRRPALKKVFLQLAYGKGSSYREISSEDDVIQKDSQGTIIFGENILIVSIEETPTAVLITSKTISSSYRNAFDAMWEIAKS